MAPTKERTSIKVSSERAVLAAVYLPESRFNPDDPLGELASLAKTAGAEVVAELIQRRDKPDPGGYMGRGKLEELRRLCDQRRASLIIFDQDLSPSQIANIEQATERKVIDRSELILDIFAGRATTHEAKLQVELAQLEYTYPRLRAMWDHLERIVGIGGVVGIGARGPGEQQIEIDRRIVQRRRTQLKRELEQIQKRKARQVRDRKSDHFMVGLVGYTNAGKSTLFNALTTGGAHADDRLFATLLTRTRQWDVGGGETVMLSDTVGFVRDLPHNLIASFKATLEETTHADLVLIVLDVSDPSAELQYRTVMETLDEIFEETAEIERSAEREWSPPKRLLLLNKVDQLRDNSELLVWLRREPEAIPICAADPSHRAGADGIERLREKVREAAQGEVRDALLTLPIADAKSINTIENRAEVLERRYNTDVVTLRVRIGERQLAQLRSAGARLRVEPAE